MAIESVEHSGDSDQETLIRIGALAKASKETIPTIRHWTKQGLLSVVDFTEGGYQLYSMSSVSIAKQIRECQQKDRLTLPEIKTQLSL